MAIKLSHSSVRCYTECGKKYELRYVKKLKPKLQTGALLFGGALDNALNTLLETRDLTQALESFEKHWTLASVNFEPTPISKSPDVVYSKKDFDGDLINWEDIQKFKELQDKYNYEPFQDIFEIVENLKEKKAAKGLRALTEEEKILLSYAHWLCMRRKGQIMLKSYNTKILPNIAEVLSIQKKFTVTDAEGDIKNGIIDLVVKMHNGDVYVMDNKTSTMLYEPDSASKSPQLILYYNVIKEEYNPKGAGFYVIRKQIDKNKTKICKKCGHDGSEGRHRTCPVDAPDTKKRCNGSWKETIAPEAIIDTILNPISDASQELVNEMFARTKEGIKKGVFVPNLQSCGDENSGYYCEYSKLCHKKQTDDFINPEVLDVK